MLYEKTVTRKRKKCQSVSVILFLFHVLQKKMELHTHSHMYINIYVTSHLCHCTFPRIFPHIYFFIPRERKLPFLLKSKRILIALYLHITKSHYYSAREKYFFMNATCFCYVAEEGTALTSVYSYL